MITATSALAQEVAAPAGGAPPAGELAKPSGPDDLHDNRDKPLWFVGLRYRDVVVPQFMINIFADGGATVNVPMFGPELAISKHGLTYVFAAEYADYSMNPFMFKGKKDGEESYEIVSSSMKAIYFTFDLLYEIPIDQQGRFTFMVGGGVGLAPIFGDLHRNQAFPNNVNAVNPNDVTQWQKCLAPGNPGKVSKVTGQPFCDGANSHYGNYTEPSWANGGSKPFIFPWISIPQLSLRTKITKQIQVRGDLGFSITGFFFGLSAAYGL